MEALCRPRAPRALSASPDMTAPQHPRRPHRRDPQSSPHVSSCSPDGGTPADVPDGRAIVPECEREALTIYLRALG